METPWMQTWEEVKEAVPPRMTRFIGLQMLAYLLATRDKRV